MTNTPDRLSETLGDKFGIKLEAGTVLPDRKGFSSVDEVVALENDIADCFLQGRGEYVTNFSPAVIRFLISQGVGSQFVLRVDPRTNKTRADGKSLDVFAAVHQDTDSQREELRIAIIGNSGLLTSEAYDPHRVDRGLDPENVTLVLSGVSTLGRGLHASTKAPVAQPGHILSVIAANLPNTEGGKTVLALEPNKQAHLPDITQQRGGSGLLSTLSENGNTKNIFENPLTQLPIMSARAFKEGFVNFQMVIPNFLLEKVGNADNWEGRVDASTLNAGRIRLVRGSNTESVKGMQEMAFAQVLRMGQTDQFLKRVEVSTKSGGW